MSSIKVRVNSLKPRNPIALAARLRHAGSHRTGSGSRRQQNRAALRHELERMKDST